VELYLRSSNVPLWQGAQVAHGHLYLYHIVNPCEARNIRGYVNSEVFTSVKSSGRILPHHYTVSEDNFNKGLCSKLHMISTSQD